MKANISNLVLSMVINGHDTSLSNIVKVTGCNWIEIYQNALPYIWDYARNCPIDEHMKIYTLRKELLNKIQPTKEF